MYYIITRLLRNERIFTNCFSWDICIINPHNPYSLLLSTLFKLFFKYFAIIHIKSPHYNIYPPPDSQVGGKKELLFISEFISNRTVSEKSHKSILIALPEHHITYLRSCSIYCIKLQKYNRK